MRHSVGVVGFRLRKLSSLPSPAELVDLHKSLEVRLTPETLEPKLNASAIAHLPMEVRDALREEFRTRCGDFSEPSDAELHEVAKEIFAEVDDATKAAKLRLEEKEAALPEFLEVPFGGFGGPAHAPKGALADGVARYQRAWPADERVALLDLGAEAATNLSAFRIVKGRYEPSRESCDGIHPTAVRHAELGAALASRVERLLQTTGGEAALDVG